jgi:hypothetical protein
LYKPLEFGLEARLAPGMSPRNATRRKLTNPILIYNFIVILYMAL